MNDDPRYELISAYLDGELVPAERAEVEQLLVEDAVARQLYEELRALGATLRALPRRQLDEAFSQQVLRRTERVMLSRREPEESSDTDRDGKVGSIFPFGRSARSWAWAAMAIAAAALIMVFNPQREPEPERVARREAEPMAGERSTRLGADRPSASEAAQEQGGWSALDEPAAEKLADKKLADRAADEAPAPLAAKGAAPPAEALMEKDSQSADSPADDFRYRDATSKIAKREDQPLGKAAERRAEPQMAQQPAAGEEAAQTKEGELYAQIAELADEGVMVVQIDVSPQAAARGAFEQLFVSQSIQWDEEPPVVEPPLKAKSGPAPAPASERGKQPSAQLFAGADGEARNESSDLQMVYVEAPPATVEATIADLASRPRDFPALEVEPAPGARRQQPLATYNRGQMQQSLQNQLRGNYAARPANQAPESAPSAPALPDDRPAAGAFSKAASPDEERKTDTFTGKERQAAVGRAQRVRAPYELRQNQAGLARTLADRDGLKQQINDRSRAVGGGQASTLESAGQPAQPPGVPQQDASAAQQSAPDDAMRVLFVLRVVPDEPPSAESP